MSWTPDLIIGELRPWPDMVRVLRGNSTERQFYVSVVQCSDCVRWEMYGNRCQGWCCEWSTVTGGCEYCSRGERKDER